MHLYICTNRFSKLAVLAPDGDARALNINATCMALVIRSKRCIKGMKAPSRIPHYIQSLTQATTACIDGTREELIVFISFFTDPNQFIIL